MPTAEEKRILGVLRKSPALVEAPVDSLNKLMVGAQFATYRARQVVYLPGDRASGVYFVGNGRVKISKVTRDGKELTLAYRATGDFFGETCLLDGGPREEMVEAMEPCTAVEVPQDQLDHLLKTNVDVAYPFARTLSPAGATWRPRSSSSSSRTSAPSWPSCCLRLGVGVRRRGQEAASCWALKITHQEMANLIGSTRETVSLTLSQFKRKG